LKLVTAAANGNALLGKQIASNARSWLQRSPANPAKQFKPFIKIIIIRISMLC